MPITDLVIHDPSTLIKRGKDYWVFGTGKGCPAFSSVDRLRWTFRGPVFAQLPSWVKETVPKHRGSDVWAPDVWQAGGWYYLYYSVSTFGSNVSAIGLAVNRTLGPDGWEDRGIVVRSEARDNFNAIDPCVTQTPDRKLWMAFGSFWSGIKLIELDPATGKRVAPDSPLHALAAHPQNQHNAIEAPFLFRRGGFWYLFVNWDYCCRGAKSTYHIRVGRAAQITGPYLDKAGVDLLKGGGTLLLSTRADDGSGAAFDDNVGPGHAGILSEKGTDHFSFHYEYARERAGKPVLALGTVEWNKDGWPTLVLK